jgi:rhodanese-related sulfurtransferase
MAAPPLLAVVSFLAAALAAPGGRADVVPYVGMADLRADGGALLVDARPAEAYRRGHADGAINLAPSALRASRLLRGREVVVVDAGWGDPALEAACARATQAASLRILHGGMAAWRPEDGPTPLSAADYLRVERNAGWIVVDLRGVTNAAARLAAATTNQAAATRVLLIDEDGRRAEELRAAMARWSGPPVFRLEGGAAALAAERRRATSLQAPTTVATRAPPGALVRRLPAGGCGCAR